jgi:hypothetical protein
MNSLVVVFTMVTHHLILILIFDYFEWMVKVVAVDKKKLLDLPPIFKIVPFMNAAHEPIMKFQAMKKTSYNLFLW